jgi:hypothetical protein
MFVKRALAEQIGGFDESLGVGAGTPWGSGEEADFLIRIIDAGYRLYYRPELYVRHENVTKLFTPGLVRRADSYGAGMGRVLNKHRYPLWKKLEVMLRPVAGMLRSLSRGELQWIPLYWASLKGRWRGLTSRL